MKNNMIILVLALIFASLSHSLRALSVEKDYPNDAIDPIPQTAGIALEVYATPTNSSDCLTFSWSDDNGFYSTGTTTGTTNNLTYWPKGNLYGQNSITLTVTVTDTSTDEPPVKQSFTLVAPILRGLGGYKDLSFYNGVPFASSATGGPYTTLKVSIQPPPNGAISYSWWVLGAAISPTADPSGNFSIVTSCGATSAANDQDLQLIDPDGKDVDADLPLTVHWPKTSSPFGDPAYATDDTVYPGVGTIKGWETDYTMQLLDQIGSGNPMPDGTPNNESFDSWSGNITYQPGSDVSGGTSNGPLPSCAGGNGTYTDDYVVPGYLLRVPEQVHYGEPYTEDSESTVPQYYYSGSNTAAAGVKVNTHTLTLRRGHATQD